MHVIVAFARKLHQDAAEGMLELKLTTSYTHMSAFSNKVSVLVKYPSSRLLIYSFRST